MKKCQRVKESVKTSLLRAVSCFAWLAPCIAYFIFHLVFIKQDTAFVFLGYLGAFLLGFSLFVCVNSSKTAQLFKSGSVWKIFLPPFALGVLLISVSIIFIFVPQISAVVSQQIVRNYFLLWLALIVLSISYALFRPNIRVLLRRAGMRKADINRLMKGSKNFWWYAEVQKTHALGWLYFANKGFTIALAGTFILLLFLGWWQPVQRLLGALSAFELVFSSLMLFWVGWRTELSLFDRQRKRFQPSGLFCFFVYCVFLLWIATQEFAMLVF